MQVNRWKKATFCICQLNYSIHEVNKQITGAVYYSVVNA